MCVCAIAILITKLHHFHHRVLGSKSLNLWCMTKYEFVICEIYWHTMLFPVIKYYRSSKLCGLALITVRRKNLPTTLEYYSLAPTPCKVQTIHHNIMVGHWQRHMESVPAYLQCHSSKVVWPLHSKRRPSLLTTHLHFELLNRLKKKGAENMLQIRGKNQMHIL